MTLPTLQEQQEIIQQIRQAQIQRESFLEQMQARQKKGLAVAKQIAQRLKGEFGVQKVVLFGSLLQPEHMDTESDIDLAVWGLPIQLLYRAGATIEEGHDFPVDLVPIEQAKPHIKAAIAEGIEL
jgi:predicted nucleotidyltransferase